MQHSLEKILSKVSVCLNVTINDIKGERKNGNIPKARHLYCYIARLNGYTFKKIGAKINRNHATVMNSCNVIENELEIYSETNEFIKKIETVLECESIENIVIQDVDLLSLTKIYTNRYFL